VKQLFVLGGDPVTTLSGVWLRIRLQKLHLIGLIWQKRAADVVRLCYHEDGLRRQVAGLCRWLIISKVGVTRLLLWHLLSMQPYLPLFGPRRNRIAELVSAAKPDGPQLVRTRSKHASAGKFRRGMRSSSTTDRCSCDSRSWCSRGGGAASGMVSTAVDVSSAPTAQLLKSCLSAIT